MGRRTLTVLDGAETGDLHELCKVHGLEAVAGVLDITKRCLMSIRSGEYAITVDDLYRLLGAYPNFDLYGTVRLLGHRRRQKGRASHGASRKALRDV
jgi:hypothetical protein